MDRGRNLFLTSVKTFLLIFLTFIYIYAFSISKDTFFQSVATKHFSILHDTVILSRQLTNFFKF